MFQVNDNFNNQVGSKVNLSKDLMRPFGMIFIKGLKEPFCIRKFSMGVGADE